MQYMATYKRRNYKHKSNSKAKFALVILLSAVLFSSIGYALYTKWAVAHWQHMR